ncbi:FIP1[III]-like protein [Cardamine amara subsp. amara]|uniref:FIP1[III]-like protein n=1 Tax=Cardamine amara subsp. amara TaxID=228776 RepID=A0ABD1AYT1_CARAN
MDSTDDDFGELYVDVKSQASPAFAGDVGLVKSCEEPKCATNFGTNRGFEGTVKPDSEDEMEKSGVVAKDLSSCVDACAVNLTEANEESEYSDSDDDLNIMLKDDDSTAFPVVRKPNTNNGGYASANVVKASETFSFQRRRTGNWCKRPNTGMVNGRMMMDSSANNNACIDSSLAVSQCGYSFSHTWSRKTFDVFEKKPWRNSGADISDFFNYGFNEQSWKDYCKPLGRAIEVQGGTLERIPSVDLRPPRVLDPDVVIQIPVTNDIEELSSMTPVKARSIIITSNEASRSDDSHSNNDKDLNSVDDSIKDEAFVGCQDDNTQSISGEQPPPTENCCSKEATPCDEEMIEEEKEKTFCNSDEADSSSVERESSLGDRICLSPTSSCSVGKNEESEDYETESSKDSATDDQRQVTTPPRRARLAEHEAINIKGGERSGTKHYTHRRSHKDLSKRHCERADYAEHGRIKHRGGKDASPTRDPDLGKKVRSHHGSLYRDSNKNWQNGLLVTLERDETEGKDFVHSNREKCHGRLYTSLDHARHREHMFGWCNNIKESSWGRGFDHSNSYRCEARVKEHTSRSYFSLHQRNSRASFKEEDERYGRHHCERKHVHERGHALGYESNKEINRCDWLREPYSQDRIPITDRDYMYQFEYSSAHGMHNPKQSHENDLYRRRRGDYDYRMHLHRYEDGVHREESRNLFERSYMEMHSFAEVGRREFQGYKRWEEFSEIDKRDRYTPDWHFDRFVSEKDGYKYRTQDAWPSQRDYSWRDDTRDFTTTEAYDSHNNHLYKAAPRDEWNPCHSDNVRVQDKVSYDDDWVRTNRRRYEMVDEIHCSVREVTHSEHPPYTDSILVRDIRIPTHNRMTTKQRSGYFKGHICEIDERHHRSKKLRGNGHAFIKCQDPVDLTGTHRKLSNQSKKRFFNGKDTKEHGDCQKPRKFSCKSAEKAVMQIGDLNDREEGETIEEGRKVKDVEIDKERIQESLKKMEKRGERFKESKLAKLVEATFESQTEVRAKTDSTNQQRPIRKRRWCAS